MIHRNRTRAAPCRQPADFTQNFSNRIGRQLADVLAMLGRRYADDRQCIAWSVAVGRRPADYLSGIGRGPARYRMNAGRRTGGSITRMTNCGTKAVVVRARFSSRQTVLWESFENPDSRGYRSVSESGFPPFESPPTCCQYLSIHCIPLSAAV